METLVIQAPKKSSAFEWSEPELVRSITRESFFEFVVEFWDTVEYDKLVLNWHIEYVCMELQNLAERVFKRLPKKGDMIINIPPGSTKSMMASVLFPAWVWTRMPHAQFVTVSHKHELAMELSRKSRDVITSPKYKTIFPEIELRSDQSGKTHFMNRQGGFRVASGSGGMIGFHGHFIIVDDPIDPESIGQSGSLTTITTVNNWMDGTVSQRMTNKTVTPIILIMQRLHQDDPTAHMIKTTPIDGIRHICLPGELTKDVKPKGVTKFYKKGVLDPVRHPRSFLEKIKMKGQYFYAGQFLQDPVPEGGGMFKTERIVIDTPPLKWTKVVRYWDTAVSEKKTACYTVGLKMGKNCDGRFWILDVKRGRWGASARRQVIRQTAETDGRNVIVGLEQEPGASGKETAESQAKELAGFRVKLDRPTGDKVVRADSLAAQVNAGNVSMVRGDWNDALIEELRFFPKSTYKDQADAGSGAFKELTTARVGFGVIGVV